VQAPIIATFIPPAGFDFPAFYDALAAQGYLIYPGKLTRRDSFRIGCIGALTPEDFSGLLKAIGEIVS
jgi:2-aminoethylphosphonate-pyruvate transaminase